MSSLSLVIVAGAILAAIAVIAYRRIRLSRDLDELTENINNTFAAVSGPSRTSGIGGILAVRYEGRVVTAELQKAFTCRFSPLYKDACKLSWRAQKRHVPVPDTVRRFILDYDRIPDAVRQHNDEIFGNLLDRHKIFFDNCLKYPLDMQQRRSILSEEDNCLVVSSAGSGKTSSIVGRVKYLIEIKKVAPERILLISYTNKAAAELTERMCIPGLRGYTFHKLAIDLIGRYRGQKPSICDNTDALFIKVYRDLLNDTAFRRHAIEYFVDYQVQDTDWERQIQERRQQLSEQKAPRLKALLPDMDGNAVNVRSKQEQQICFVLSSLGVKFRYEEPYEYPLADELHSQYKPDFSIYFEQGGRRKRIYLEHFGVDERGMVPAWFAEDRNISYEEANKRYNDGITWKKAAHEKFGTVLLTSSSADFHYADIRVKLKKQLVEAGVPVRELTDAELFEAVLPKDSRQEKAFIRLMATFTTLLKSSCRSLNEVLQQVDHDNDTRSRFVIRNIFSPVYERYTEMLRQSGQIDFTDVILQATAICRMAHPVSFEHIIVDEFQDISIDRYRFLKALRESNPPAKLYCVGDDWQSIYRFSGSDMALFNSFPDYFGPTEINKIETTYRFGEPSVSMSSGFIQRNSAQIKKDIHPFNEQIRTDLSFQAYSRSEYCDVVERLVASVPEDKSIFLLGRYSFDDYYLSFKYKNFKEGSRFYYIIGNRKIEFLTVHKSKGLEADYVILLQCNKDTYGFPSLISDDPTLQYVLTRSDQYPFGEERRIFYVAITRAKIRTWVLYDRRFPSVFVDEFLHPEQISMDRYVIHPNANKRWSRREDEFLLTLHREGKSIRYIAGKMGRSQTSIVMRLEKLKGEKYSLPAPK